MNFEEAPDPLRLSYSNQGRTLQITSAPLNGSRQVNLVNAQNINLYDIVFGDNSEAIDLRQVTSPRIGENDPSPPQTDADADADAMR